jgi:hypothetical protein
VSGNDPFIIQFIFVVNTTESPGDRRPAVNVYLTIQELFKVPVYISLAPPPFILA